MPCRKKRQRSRALMSRIRLFLLFWHTATVALHFGTWFSAVPHIIPASQILSKNATPGFGQGFPERVSPAGPMACRRWASTNEGDDPEIVLAGCDDNLTLEVMAAAQILRQEVPEWRLLKQIKKPTAFSLSRAHLLFSFIKSKPLEFVIFSCPNL